MIAESMRPTLTPTHSRKRERGRAANFINPRHHAATPDEFLLPLAGDGGPEGRMRISRSLSIKDTRVRSAS